MNINDKQITFFPYNLSVQYQVFVYVTNIFYAYFLSCFSSLLLEFDHYSFKYFFYLNKIQIQSNDLFWKKLVVENGVNNWIIVEMIHLSMSISNRKNTEWEIEIINVFLSTCFFEEVDQVLTYFDLLFDSCQAWDATDSIWNKKIYYDRNHIRLLSIIYSLVMLQQILEHVDLQFDWLQDRDQWVSGS